MLCSSFSLLSFTPFPPSWLAGYSYLSHTRYLFKEEEDVFHLSSLFIPVSHTLVPYYYPHQVLRKKQLVQKQQVERTKLERKILANINHPFIVRLHYSFQVSYWV
jgi:hypothetical protein